MQDRVVVLPWAESMISQHDSRIDCELLTRGNLSNLAKQKVKVSAIEMYIFCRFTFWMIQFGIAFACFSLCSSSLTKGLFPGSLSPPSARACWGALLCCIPTRCLQGAGGVLLCCPRHESSGELQGYSVDGGAQAGFVEASGFPAVSQQAGPC